jgi:hypothetical protein
MATTMPLRGKWRRALSLAALITLLSTLAAPQSVLAAADWPAAVPLSTNSDDRATTPAIAIDKDGFSHVVWVGGEEGEWQVYYTNNRGGNFFRARIISNGQGNHERPDIAVSPDGRVHVIASRNFAGSAEVNYFEGESFGAAWPNRIRNISNTDGNAFEPAIAADDGGNVYFVWIDNRNDYYRLYYTSRVGGVYGPTIQLTNRTFDKFPDMLVTGGPGNRQIHIVYQGGRNGSSRNSDFDIYYLNAVVVGGPSPTLQVGTPFQLSDRDERLFAFTPAITTNGANELLVAYNQIISGEREVYLQRSINGGATWTPPVNLTNGERSFASLPSLTYYESFGRPTVTVAWQEGQNDPRLFNVDYFPDNNSFGAAIDRLSNAGNAINVELGGKPGIGRVAAVFHPRVGNSKVFYTARAVGLGATPSVDGLVNLNGNLFSRSNQVTVRLTLDNGSLPPSELRYAFDREPRDGDPVLPYATTFTATAPPSDSCERRLFVQVRQGSGNFSEPRSFAFRIDSDVRANISLNNPAAGAPNYTRQLTATLAIDGVPDCASLQRSVPALPQVVNLGKPGFVGPVALLAGPDGPRTVPVELTDSLGNNGTFSRQIIVDTRAPTLSGGSLSAPNGSLPTALATLAISGSVVDDGPGGYPGGFWGVEIANTLTPNDSGSLRWTAVQALTDPGDPNTITIRNWNVTAGLGRPLGDPGLADRPITVLVRFIDGAGNPTTRTLSDTVTLQAGYVVPRELLPVVVRP